MQMSHGFIFAAMASGDPARFACLAFFKAFLRARRSSAGVSCFATAGSSSSEIFSSCCGLGPNVHGESGTAVCSLNSSWLSTPESAPESSSALQPFLAADVATAPAAMPARTFAPGLRPRRLALQLLLHVRTSSQHFSHFFLHVNGRSHTTQVLTGKLWGFRKYFPPECIIIYPTPQRAGPQKTRNCWVRRMPKAGAIVAHKRQFTGAIRLP
mmetsp:Transcript_19772/g.38735  ORF Transcript_19772/g.38735 Transcript_19772/m.38735 type:complete len:212 (+) Transcript_19772:511-1146(+)